MRNYNFLTKIYEEKKRLVISEFLILICISISKFSAIMYTYTPAVLNFVNFNRLLYKVRHSENLVHERCNYLQYEKLFIQIIKG